MSKPIGVALATLGLTLSTGAGAAPADAPRQEGGYAFRSDLTLGGADAEDDHFFYEKYGSVEVGADAQGHIYVLDNGNARIQVYATDGSLVRSLGSAGDGPGEFRIPSRLAVNAQGEFAVFDMGQGRVSVFDARGELLRDQLITAGVADLALGDDGTLYVGYEKYGPAQVEAYGRDGELVWQAGEGTPSPGRMINIEIGVQTVAPRLAVFPDGDCVRAPKGDYEVQMWAAGGGSGGVWMREFERRAFSADELAPPSDDEEGGAQEVVIVRRGPGESGGHGGGGGSDMGGEAVWSGSEGETFTFDTDSLKDYMPTHHSAVRGVLAFDDGRVWVLTSELDGGRPVVDEWSAQGTWERRFAMPSEYDWVCLGRDGRIYAVTHDEDDYPSVHRLVVEAGA